MIRGRKKERKGDTHTHRLTDTRTDTKEKERQTDKHRLESGEFLRLTQTHNEQRFLLEHPCTPNW